MFEKLMRDLKKLEKGFNVTLPVVPDAHGFIDKECPAEACRTLFKVHAEDWTALFRDEAVFCPACRAEAPSKSWWTTAQVEHAQKMGINKMANIVNRGLEEGAHEFNRSQPRSGFITMSMKMSPSARKPVDLPLPVADALELEIQCEGCRARFRVLGTAFFCPCCGANLVERIFDDALRKVRLKADTAATVEAAVAATSSKDDAALVSRSMIETAFTDVVTAFQAFLEQRFTGRYCPPAPPPKKNVFQRLTDGSALWRDHAGEGYDAWLTAAELERLAVLFQRRHVLAHRDGIIDADYLTKTADASYKAGQRLVTSRGDVHELADLVARIVAGVRALG